MKRRKLYTSSRPDLYRLLPVVVLILAGLIITLIIRNSSTPSADTEASPETDAYTVYPIADTYVNKSYPKKNYGTQQNLVVDGTSDRTSYIMFDLTQFAGIPISTAHLQFKIISRSIQGQVVYSVPDTSWSETEMTYPTRPQVGAEVARIGKTVKNEIVRIDMTDLVRSTAGKRMAVMLKSLTADGIGVFSRESQYKPSLVIVPVGDVISPTPISFNTPAPTRIPTVTLTGTPTPTWIPGPTGALSRPGIWISPSELTSLPMSGETWNAMVSVANGSLGTANLADQNSTHPEKTLAVALVAARTGNASYTSKAVDAIMSAIGTENNTDPNCSHSRNSGHPAGARSLALGRNLIGYVIAADVLRLRSGEYDPEGKGTKFEQWVNQVRYRDNCPNTGSGSWPSGEWYNLSQTHNSSVSNGNALAGASRIAAAAYLGDIQEAQKAWTTFRRYVGDTTANADFKYNSFSETWRFSVQVPVGINPKGAVLGGYPVDGVLPNDQGRGGSRPSDPNTAPGYTQYPWEGLQGVYSQALLLDRIGFRDAAGKGPWNTQNDALLRAVQYQWYLQNKFGGDWYDANRAAWVKHLAYYKYGYKPLQYASHGGGRTVDWVQWTHPK